MYIRNKKIPAKMIVMTITPKITDAIWTKADPPHANNTMAQKH